MIRRAVFALVMVAAAPFTHAIEAPDDGDSGNALLALCDDPNRAWRSLECMSYVQGFLAGFNVGATVGERVAKDEVAPGSVLLCIPDNVTGRQAKDIVVKYLKSHPESRHEKTGVLIHRAYAELFACPR
jgi:Rap1a immunity proteins